MDVLSPRYTPNIIVQVVELREQTVAWLQKNGLPVQVEGDQVGNIHYTFCELFHTRQWTLWTGLLFNLYQLAETHPNPQPTLEPVFQVVIAGAVRLEPPYTGESALADNEIVLSRVQAVLDSGPHTV